MDLVRVLISSLERYIKVFYYHHHFPSLLTLNNRTSLNKTTPSILRLQLHTKDLPTQFDKQKLTMSSYQFEENDTPQGYREVNLDGPVLTAEEVDLAYDFAMAAERQPCNAFMPDFSDGYYQVSHDESCWRTLRERLWTDWADLLYSLDRRPQDGLDVTAEEVEDYSYLGGCFCLCHISAYEFEMGICEASGLPMLSCTVQIYRPTTDDEESVDEDMSQEYGEMSQGDDDSDSE